jgi:histidine ammonia-lyase
MSTFAARRLHDMLDNIDNIIAIELLAAAQGIEFHHPQHSSEPLEKTLTALREVSPRYEDDRGLSADIGRVAALIESGTFREHAASVLPAHTA